MILGCIADDFTGASDAASYLAKGGMRTLLLSDTGWNTADLKNIDAIVIALKTRTIPAKEAIEQSLKAIRWLKEKGAEKFYFKYCSTFDSTPEGNIGPVADAIMDELKTDHAVLSPALPDNGRIVKDGNLYVNGVLLDESPMKYHPLTPMWDHRLKVLMEAQSRYNVYSSAKDNPLQKKCYYVPDYQNNEDAKEIIKEYGKDLFLTGGSGLLEPLAASWNIRSKTIESAYEVKGNVIILAGSCSVATRKQIKAYCDKGFKAYKIDPSALLNGEKYDDILDQIGKNQHENILIYSSDTPENVEKYQRLGKEKTAEAIESFLSQCALKARNEGIHKIIVAGGETSGAITKALGYHHFRIGESVAPGVPILIPLEEETKLILKSGNFGKDDFFIHALTLLNIH